MIVHYKVRVQSLSHLISNVYLNIENCLYKPHNSYVKEAIITPIH